VPSRKKRTKDRVTLERIYRKVLALEKALVNQIALNRARLESFSGTVRDHVRETEANTIGLRVLSRDIVYLTSQVKGLIPIVSHCERLMREKITLQRQLAEANRFMAQPAREMPQVSICGFCGIDLDKIAFCNEDDQQLVCPHGKGRAPGSFDATDTRKPLGMRGVCVLQHLHQPGIICAVCRQ
jgi:hypothetical protein